MKNMTSYAGFEVIRGDFWSQIIGFLRELAEFSFTRSSSLI
jgi:hypothetical protein